jgi:hypothetical protein
MSVMIFRGDADVFSLLKLIGGAFVALTLLAGSSQIALADSTTLICSVGSPPPTKF